MLRRSFSVLVLLSLLGLAMILVYAAWNKTGANEALTRSEALLDGGRASDALTLLNATERSLGPGGEPALRGKLYYLRARAHEELGNYQQALRDLGVCIHDFAGVATSRTQLRRDKVRLLVAAGSKDKPKLTLALTEAEHHLDQQPDDGVVHELAGRALQMMYRRTIDTLLKKDLLQLPQPYREAAISKLITFLYREPGDAEGERLREQFTAEIRRLGSPMTREEIHRKVADVRRQIQESAHHYRVALGSGTRAFAALQGYTGMLLRGDRLDETAVLSWLYLQRFPNAYGSAIAATRAMDAWMRMGDPEQAARVGRAWLGTQGVEGFGSRYEIDERWIAAYVLYARAHFAIGDSGAIVRLMRSIHALDADRKPNAWPSAFYIEGLRAYLAGDPKTTEEQLASYCKHTPAKAAPRIGFDYFRQALELRYASAKRADDAVLKKRVLDSWIRYRPQDPSPRLERGRFEFAQDRAHLAVLDANTVIASSASTSWRDRALMLRLEASNTLYRYDRLDAASLFSEIVTSRSIPASIPDPVLHIGIAKLAIEKKLWRVARQQLREAAEHFRWSPTLRLMQARCSLALGEDALYDVSQVLANDPKHLAARLIELEALNKSGAGKDRIDASRLALVVHHPDAVEAANVFAERLLDRGAWDLAIQVAERSKAAIRHREQLAWVHGRALLGKGEPKRAITVLLSVPAESPHRVDALALALETAAASSDSAKVSRIRRLLLECKPSAPVLRHAADVLASQRQFTAALDLLRRIDDDPALEGDRDGLLYVNIGRMLSALGRIEEAQDEWEAALPHEDGSVAIPLLGLSYLLRNKESDAKDVLALSPKPIGSQLLLAYLAWVRGDIASARGALSRFRSRSKVLLGIVQYALELAHDPAKTPAFAPAYPPLARLVAKHPARVFEALALAGEVAFAARAREAIDSIDSACPDKEADECGSVIGLLRALQDVLGHRPEDALDKLDAVLASNPLFFPAYDEFILVAETHDPERLTAPKMLERYALLATALPAGMVAQGSTYSRFPTVWYRGLAEAAARNDATDRARTLYLLSHLSDTEDPEPIQALASLEVEAGRLPAAIEHQRLAADKSTGPRRIRNELALFQLALKALATPQPTTKLRDAIGDVVTRARMYHLRTVRGEATPLAAATLLTIRGLTDDDRFLDLEARRKETVRICDEYLAAFRASSLASRFDTDGPRLVIGEIERSSDAATSDARLHGVLEHEPSIPDLWIMAARYKEKLGRPAGAVEQLAWLPALLPDNTDVAAELGIMMGRYPDTDAKARIDLLGFIEALPSSKRLELAKALLGFRLGRSEAARRSFANLDDLAPYDEWIRSAATIMAADGPGAIEAEEQRLRTWLSTHPDSRLPRFTDLTAQLARLIAGPGDDATGPDDGLERRRRRRRSGSPPGR